MDILSAANDFFTALASASPSSSSSSAASSRSSSPSPTSTTSSSSRLCTSSQILPYFSTTAPVFVQHVHASNPHPQSSRLYGLNAVRSYFDLIDTHWVRVRTTLRPTAAATAASKSDDPAFNGSVSSSSSSRLVSGLGGGVGRVESTSASSSPDSTPSLSDLMDVDEVDAPITTATSLPNPTSSTSTSASALRVDHAARSVSLNASTTWKWRKSGHTWVEDFILTIHFDDALKVTRFVVVTVSAPETCVLKAVDQVASGSGIRMRSKSPSTAGAAPHTHLHVPSLSPTTIQRSRGFTSSIVETSIAEDAPMSGVQESGSPTLKVPNIGGFKTRRATASGALGGFVAGSGSWQDTASSSGDGSKEWMQTRGPGAVFLV